MEESVGYATAAGTVKPRLPPVLCPHCGVCSEPVLGPGAGPHVGCLTCAACGKHVQWASRRVVQAFLEEKTGGMRASINKVFLMGTISKYGVTVKYATSGTPCASFTLLLAEQGQDGKEHRLFVECEVWGKKAEATSELEAGQLCLFEGRLAKRKRGETWDTVVSGLDLTPLLAPQASLTGSTN